MIEYRFTVIRGEKELYSSWMLKGKMRQFKHKLTRDCESFIIDKRINSKIV